MAARLWSVLCGTVLGTATAGVQLTGLATIEGIRFPIALHELETIPAPLLQGIEPRQCVLPLVVGQGNRFLF